LPRYDEHPLDSEFVANSTVNTVNFLLLAKDCDGEKIRLFE
jgi:hypothetical protein